MGSSAVQRGGLVDYQYSSPWVFNYFSLRSRFHQQHKAKVYGGPLGKFQRLMGVGWGAIDCVVLITLCFLVHADWTLPFEYPCSRLL